MAHALFNSNKGIPFPYGFSLIEGHGNFSVVSKKAKQVTLILLQRSTKKNVASFPLDPLINKTGDIWHIGLFFPEKSADLLTDIIYYYLVDGRPLLDPYAKSVDTSIEWGEKTLSDSSMPSYFPFAEMASPSPFDFRDWAKINAAFSTKRDALDAATDDEGIVFSISEETGAADGVSQPAESVAVIFAQSLSGDTPPRLPLQDLLIYEMHVRGFTQDPSSLVQQPGKFLGIIEKIPHLLELGVNAIELLPIQEFNECEYEHPVPSGSSRLFNYWGYSTINFFSPMNRYASSKEANAAVDEFKHMVLELHRNGIEVILDIVFNHTAEGGEKGIILSFKGFDPQAYYMIDEKGAYLNFTGCGNTFKGNHPVSMQLILDALRYWVTEMHVDGFRFDLASIFNRAADGHPISISPLVEAITLDPCLSQIKLIAEPWDAAGLYHVGAFAQKSSRWSEWNDKYRDSIRKFIKGTPGSLNEFSKRISGSQDIYHGHSPLSSLNFITAHDGFTLADLVSYNQKHNLANGEDNRDGVDRNESWNCGAEGETKDDKILSLRERQMRNLHLALMISQGIPMLLMGDEYGHTKQGNNNTWCQDNSLNWFQWDQLKKNSAFYRFYRLMIQFRKRHPILRRTSFLTDQDIEWHGIQPCQPKWNSPDTFIAFTLKQRDVDHVLYIAFNAQGHDVSVHLPSPPKFKTWRWIANTANPSPQDFYENGNGPLQISRHYHMLPYSSIILKAI